jgi:hypothetical protein
MLEKVGIPRAIFYRWYDLYQELCWKLGDDGMR